MEKSNIPEEVTITPVIRDLERLFLRLFTFIKVSLVFLTKQLMKLLQFCARYFLVLTLVTLMGGIIGFYSYRYFPQEYISTIIVQPSVNANSQLANDVSYVNSLIEKGEVETLSNLFKISSEDAQTLSRMEVVSVTTEIERLRYIDEFYKGLDTATKNNYEISRLLNDDKESIGKRFAISVSGFDPTVFSKLEPQFFQFLERVPDLQKRKRAALDLLQLQKDFYLKQLNDLDTLKKVINTSRLAEAKKTETSSATSISLGTQQSSEALNILEVYDRSNGFFREIMSIESKMYDLTTCYKIYSSFSAYGSDKGMGNLKRAGILGGSLFLITFFILGIINLLGSLRKRDA